MSDGPYDYAREIHDVQKVLPLRDQVWNGSGWSDVPDRGELAGGES